MANVFLQTASEQPPASSEAAAFIRQGEYWHLAFDGQVVMLRDGKGMHYLAALLRRAGQRVPVTELAPGSAAVHEPDDHAVLERTRSAVTKRIRDALQRIEKNHSALGRHLGGQVKTGYECMYAPDPDQPVIWQL